MIGIRLRHPGVLAALLFALATVGASGQSAFADAPVSIQRIVPAQPTGVGPDQVGVLVFFDLTPRSGRLLAQLREWASNAGDRVVIDREPIVQPADQPLARAFVVARTLGVVQPVLPRILELGGGSLTHPQIQKALAAAFQAWGIDSLEFDAAWRSPAASSGLIRGEALAERFDVRKGPVVVVNGTWRLSTPANDVAGLISALGRKVSEVANMESENR